MALSTYSDLKSSILDWMFDRQDLATVNGDFVTLCEGELNNGAEAVSIGGVVIPPVPALRTRDQLTTTDLTPSSGTVTLPSDYLEFRQVTALTNPRRVLRLVAPSYRDAAFPNRESGDPAFFSISNGNLLVLPVTASDIQLEYYAKIPALSDSNTTNWLLDMFPNIYLYGSLKHACMFIGDMGRAATMGSMFSGLVGGLSSSDVKSMYARASARVSRLTP